MVVERAAAAAAAAAAPVPEGGGGAARGGGGGGRNVRMTPAVSTGRARRSNPRDARSSSPIGSVYESPTDEHHPPFFDSVLPPSSAAKLRPLYAPRSPTHADHHDPSASSNQLSLDDVVANAEKRNPNRKVGLRDRVACFQWTYFTMTMATGGIANVLHTLPFEAEWITGVGVFFCLLNITLFVLNCILLCSRFILRPGTFISSFTDQFESLFIPSFVVSIAIILINICQYGVEHAGIWLLHIMQIMFWVYVGLSVVASAGMYLILWSTLIFPVHTMTPTWVFPAYPLLLTAPFAANLIAAADKSGHIALLNSPAVALCAVTTQGTGCLIAFMISAAFIYRLMTQKMPRDVQRPGIFISIGPFGFTAGGIVQLGIQAQLILPRDFLDIDNSVGIIKIVSILVGLWMWGLAMWFFLVSVGSLWKYTRPGHSLPFQMTWWSFVFPNTALVMTTELMGQAFKSWGLQLFGCVMAVALILVWIIVFLAMLQCLRCKKLLWPKDRE